MVSRGRWGILGDKKAVGLAPACAPSASKPKGEGEQIREKQKPTGARAPSKREQEGSEASEAATVEDPGEDLSAKDKAERVSCGTYEPLWVVY